MHKWDLGYSINNSVNLLRKTGDLLRLFANHRIFHSKIRLESKVKGIAVYRKIYRFDNFQKFTIRKLVPILDFGNLAPGCGKTFLRNFFIKNGSTRRMLKISIFLKLADMQYNVLPINPLRMHLRNDGISTTL